MGWFMSRLNPWRLVCKTRKGREFSESGDFYHLGISPTLQIWATTLEPGSSMLA